MAFSFSYRVLASRCPRKKRSQGCAHPLYNNQGLFSKRGSPAGASAASPRPRSFLPQRRYPGAAAITSHRGVGPPGPALPREPSAAFIPQPVNTAGSGVASSAVQPRPMWGLQLPGWGGAAGGCNCFSHPDFETLIHLCL